MSWLSRLKNAFRPDRLDGELEEALRFHLEARAEEAVRRGMSPQDAARAAGLRGRGVPRPYNGLVGTGHARPGSAADRGTA
jgi:hypothetical protein